MNIPSVVIEREDRIGDTWRKRYPSLTVLSTRKHHSGKCASVRHVRSIMDESYI